jgi:hypothetical protein
MTETIRINKLPKSKMKAIREYTNLRAFIELGPNGEAVGYYIECEATIPNRQKVARKKHNVGILQSARLGLGPRGNLPDVYRAGSLSERVHNLVKDLVPASRETLESMIESELILTRQQATSQISYAIHHGKTLAVVTDD